MTYRITEEERARRGERIRKARSTEACSKGGITQGNVHAVNKTGVCGRSEEQMFADAQKGGLAGGKKGSQNPASQRALKAMLKDSEHQRAAQRASSHVQHHINKGRVDSRCELCSETVLTAFSRGSK